MQADGNVLLDGVMRSMVHRNGYHDRVTNLDSHMLSYLGRIYCHLFATLLSEYSNFILVCVAIILTEADSRIRSLMKFGKVNGKVSKVN